MYVINVGSNPTYCPKSLSVLFLVLFFSVKTLVAKLVFFFFFFKNQH